MERKVRIGQVWDRFPGEAMAFVVCGLFHSDIRGGEIDMVYSSAFSNPLYYLPTSGGFGMPFPSPNPGLYPNAFLPPGPGGPPYSQPFTGFFPPTYPISHHHATEGMNWGGDFKDYMSNFKFW